MIGTIDHTQIQGSDWNSNLIKPSTIRLYARNVPTKEAMK